MFKECEYITAAEAEAAAAALLAAAAPGGAAVAAAPRGAAAAPRGAAAAAAAPGRGAAALSNCVDCLDSEHRSFTTKYRNSIAEPNLPYANHDPTLNEVAVMRYLKNRPNIVQLLGVSFSKQVVKEQSRTENDIKHSAIVMEELDYILHGEHKNIHDLFVESNVYKNTDLHYWSDIYNIIKQALKSVCILHKLNIVHKQISASTFFINKKGDIVLGGFEFAKYFKEAEGKREEHNGEPLFLCSPEHLFRMLFLDYFSPQECVENARKDNAAILNYNVDDWKANDAWSMGLTLNWILNISPIKYTEDLEKKKKTETYFYKNAIEFKNLENKTEDDVNNMRAIKTAYESFNNFCSENYPYRLYDGFKMQDNALKPMSIRDILTYRIFGKPPLVPEDASSPSKINILTVKDRYKEAGRPFNKFQEDLPNDISQGGVTYELLIENRKKTLCRYYTPVLLEKTLPAKSIKLPEKGTRFSEEEVTALEAAAISESSTAATQAPLAAAVVTVPAAIVATAAAECFTISDVAGDCGDVLPFSLGEYFTKGFSKKITDVYREHKLLINAYNKYKAVYNISKKHYDNCLEIDILKDNDNTRIKGDALKILRRLEQENENLLKNPLASNYIQDKDLYKLLEQNMDNICREIYYFKSKFVEEHAKQIILDNQQIEKVKGVINGLLNINPTNRMKIETALAQLGEDVEVNPGKTLIEAKNYNVLDTRKNWEVVSDLIKREPVYFDKLSERDKYKLFDRAIIYFIQIVNILDSTDELGKYLQTAYYIAMKLMDIKPCKFHEKTPKIDFDIDCYKTFLKADIDFLGETFYDKMVGAKISIKNAYKLNKYCLEHQIRVHQISIDYITNLAELKDEGYDIELYMEEIIARETAARETAARETAARETATRETAARETAAREAAAAEADYHTVPSVLPSAVRVILPPFEINTISKKLSIAEKAYIESYNIVMELLKSEDALIIDFINYKKNLDIIRYCLLKLDHYSDEFNYNIDYRKIYDIHRNIKRFRIQTHTCLEISKSLGDVDFKDIQIYIERIVSQIEALYFLFSDIDEHIKQIGDLGSICIEYFTTLGAKCANYEFLYDKLKEQMRCVIEDIKDIAENAALVDYIENKLKYKDCETALEYLDGEGEYHINYKYSSKPNDLDPLIDDCVNVKNKLTASLAEASEYKKIFTVANAATAAATAAKAAVNAILAAEHNSEAAREAAIAAKEAAIAAADAASSALFEAEKTLKIETENAEIATQNKALDVDLAVATAKYADIIAKGVSRIVDINLVMLDTDYKSELNVLTAVLTVLRFARRTGDFVREMETNFRLNHYNQDIPPVTALPRAVAAAADALKNAYSKQAKATESLLSLTRLDSITGAIGFLDIVIYYNNAQCDAAKKLYDYTKKIFNYDLKEKRTDLTNASGDFLEQIKGKYDSLMEAPLTRKDLLKYIVDAAGKLFPESNIFTRAARNVINTDKVMYKIEDVKLKLTNILLKIYPERVKHSISTALCKNISRECGGVSNRQLNFGTIYEPASAGRIWNIWKQERLILNDLGMGAAGIVRKECKQINNVVGKSVCMRGQGLVATKYPLGLGYRKVIREIATLQYLKYLPNVCQIISIDECKIINKGDKWPSPPAIVNKLYNMDLGGTFEVIKPMWPDLFDRIVKIVNGYHMIHTLGIVHNDIKPGNILFKKDRYSENIAIADFGISNYIGKQGHDIIPISTGLRDKTIECCSPEFLIKQCFWREFPEIAKKDSSIHITREDLYKNDAWAVGLMLYNLIYAKHQSPFAKPHLYTRENNSEVDPIDIINEIFNIKGLPSDVDGITHTLIKLWTNPEYYNQTHGIANHAGRIVSLISKYFITHSKDDGRHKLTTISKEEKKISLSIMKDIFYHNNYESDYFTFTGNFDNILKEYKQLQCVIDIIDDLLEINPSKRLTLEEANNRLCQDDWMDRRVTFDKDSDIFKGKHLCKNDNYNIADNTYISLFYDMLMLFDNEWKELNKNVKIPYLIYDRACVYLTQYINLKHPDTRNNASIRPPIASVDGAPPSRAASPDPKDVANASYTARRVIAYNELHAAAAAAFSSAVVDNPVAVGALLAGAPGVAAASLALDVGIKAGRRIFGGVPAISLEVSLPPSPCVPPTSPILQDFQYELYINTALMISYMLFYSEEQNEKTTITIDQFYNSDLPTLPYTNDYRIFKNSAITVDHKWKTLNNFFTSNIDYYGETLYDIMIKNNVNEDLAQRINTLIFTNRLFNENTKNFIGLCAQLNNINKDMLSDSQIKHILMSNTVFAANEAVTRIVEFFRNDTIIIMPGGSFSKRKTYRKSNNMYKDDYLNKTMRNRSIRAR